MVVNYSVVACRGWWIELVFPLYNNCLEPGYALVAGVVVTRGLSMERLVQIIDGVAVGFDLNVLEFLRRFWYGFLLVNLYLKSCFLTCSTAKKREFENKHDRMVKNNVRKSVKKSLLPKGTKVIHSAWACKTKSTDKLCDRLNARGFKQVE
jgi:hypothetical protein